MKNCIFSIALRYGLKGKCSGFSIWKFFYLKPSIYTRPYTSIRWLCFQVTNDWNTLHKWKNGAKRIE